MCVVHQTQHRPLVALREGVHELVGVFLALQSLGVGEAGLARQRAGPHIAVAEEVTVEEFPVRCGEGEGRTGGQARPLLSPALAGVDCITLISELCRGKRRCGSTAALAALVRVFTLYCVCITVCSCVCIMPCMCVCVC